MYSNILYCLRTTCPNTTSGFWDVKWSHFLQQFRTCPANIFSRCPPETWTCWRMGPQMRRSRYLIWVPPGPTTKANPSGHSYRANMEPADNPVWLLFWRSHNSICCCSGDVSVFFSRLVVFHQQFQSSEASPQRWDLRSGQVCSDRNRIRMSGGD